ncbi:hypothetical protein NP233_g12966 [Leucocoprinus birnbaumii]|uniref:Reverse transcriptase domain-containing protein n=1 Tax=Leucocoprinus birnbaumii TaxID=56174 RepID=A0AAD5VHP5_9AGAR|nr:hypothetical protein NP233_g12966 [Leucocoprinus birnbaumii]
MGMGQGSALSPVLSALYLAPVIWLFEQQAAHVGCNILSYVNDGTLIVQCKTLEDNLPPLHKVYRIMFNLFDAFRLVMEHNKSELFHFMHQCDDANPSIALDFQLFTEASPLKPKTFWRYLGFYFDRTLFFREHIHYYCTKAISTICAMGMLGNSLRGLTPKEKRILYWACIVQGSFAISHQDAASCYSLDHWRLQDVTNRQVVATLSRTHTVQSLMGRCDALSAHVHWWYINNLGTKGFLATKSMAVDVAGKLPCLMEAFNNDSDEACPSNGIMDIFSDRISFHPRPNGASANKQTTLLDAILHKAKGEDHSAIMACNTSVSQDSTVQALAVARVWIRDPMVK